MHRHTTTSIIVVSLVLFLTSINTQRISLCDTFDESKSLGEICNDEKSLQEIVDTEEDDLIPDFDLTQIETGNIY